MSKFTAIAAMGMMASMDSPYGPIYAKPYPAPNNHEIEEHDSTVRLCVNGCGKPRVRNGYCSVECFKDHKRRMRNG